jgi:TetR/AcrR family transcriptional regulator, regulator of cefoperazone and chloramphenicol sensitivity
VKGLREIKDVDILHGFGAWNRLERAKLYNRDWILFPVARTPRIRQKDRKTELVEITYRLIAQNGLAGLRIRQVAAAAGIDNGTLHYHFSSKDALILGVVDYLIEDLQNNRAVSKGTEQTALTELHMEFEDIRLRLRRTPEQFIVLSDLAIRSWRDPVVAKMFRKLDDGWHAHLVALLERGIQQGIFRNNLNVPLCARAIMVALRGIGYQTRLPPGKVDELLSELAAQMEHWITAGDSSP